ncbi:hypothetical protein [Arenimonas daejeonensis]|uniref:hypothetical protein n=1 Tax=Arenimonas daejeonensis TaxID=370777 RepID=UPI0011BE2B39|nr:hypothetical protein [Arenimonas daejeonensis]
MTEPARKRRWPKFLAAFAVLMLIGAWWVDRQLEPVRLASTVLARLGEATGLELSFEGTPEYALRPEPRLLLENFDARVPGSATPLFRARRLEVSLPWATVWGGPIVITRIDLDGPTLDLDALNTWLASQPESSGELPVLSRGASVRDGTMLWGEWRIDGLVLDLDRFESGMPLTLELAGRGTSDTIELQLESTIAIEKLGQSTGAKVEAQGRIQFDGVDAPFVVTTDCNYHKLDNEALSCGDLFFRSESPLPTFKADIASIGRRGKSENIEIDADGWMRDWPQDWPALPAPMAGKPTHFDFAYAGPIDMTADWKVKLDWEDSHATAEFTLQNVLAWLDAGNAAPLPPLQATVTAPSIEIAGATLQGVKIIIEEDAPEEPAAEVEP